MLPFAFRHDGTESRDSSNWGGYYNFVVPQPEYLLTGLTIAAVAAALSFFISWTRRYRQSLREELSAETERIKAEETRGFEEEKLRFRTCIADELRACLSKIIPHLDELMADDDLPDGSKEKIRDVRLASGRLMETISRMERTSPDDLPEIRIPDPRTIIEKADREFLSAFNRLIEENISNPDLNMTFILERFNMANSTFYRKIKSVSGFSGIEYIHKMRVRNALRLLREKGYSISDAAYESGFNDLKHFRRVFKEELGISAARYVEIYRQKLS